MTEPIDSSETRRCRRCHALVGIVDLRDHHNWHAELEGIEKPTSDFGFWSPNGRWNANSQDWGI